MAFQLLWTEALSLPEPGVRLAVPGANHSDILQPGALVLHTCDKHRRSWRGSCLFHGLYPYSLLVVAEIRYHLRPDLMVIPK